MDGYARDNLGAPSVDVSDMNADTGCNREGICDVPALQMRVRVR